MKEQTRNTEVQINEEEIGKWPEKEFRIMSKDDQKPWKQNGENARINNKDLEELKKNLQRQTTQLLKLKIL